MTTKLSFVDLQIRSFRNINELSLTELGRINVISGNNGHGKTSALEAIYFVSTSRSFRAEKLRDLVSEGSEHCHVRAHISEGGYVREQQAALGPRSRKRQIDGAKTTKIAEFATKTPVVVFHPGDLLLASGPASLRRTLLDRVALFIEPPSAAHRRAYQKAVRERQRVLEERGVRASELFAYEELMAKHGSALSRARARAAERLSEALSRAFCRMAAPNLKLRVEYEPGGTEDPELFLKTLAERRVSDQQRRGAGFGPQKDELALSIDGRSARRHASQGQQRILALAIKTAELHCVREARGTHPVLLLDDVSSELDPTRIGAVYDFLRDTPGQVFVTTTRPNLFQTPGIDSSLRRDFRLDCGALVDAD